MTAAERADFDAWDATVAIGEDDMTPEQRAEFACVAAEFEAGRARMVPHEDVPAVLEEMARVRAA
jgi:hypothetical protein